MPHGEKVAIFGGSFDPVHLGHLTMVERCREKFGLDRVLFMPCNQSPFKKSTHANAGQRFRMLEIALKDLEWADWAEISEYEITRPGPSFSWQTAEYFSERMPDSELFWIVGTDQWDMIDRWAKPERLRELLSFIVVTRNGSKVVKRENWRYESMEFEHPASSTKIRSDSEKHSEWLTEGVQVYCREQGLYSSQNGLK